MNFYYVMRIIDLLFIQWNSRIGVFVIVGSSIEVYDGIKWK